MRRKMLHQLVILIQHHPLRSQIFLRVSLRIQPTAPILLMVVKMAHLKYLRLKICTKAKMVILTSVLSVVHTLVESQALLLDLLVMVLLKLKLKKFQIC
jgi:hypothetical protein